MLYRVTIEPTFLEYTQRPLRLPFARAFVCLAKCGLLRMPSPAKAGYCTEKELVSRALS
jgi:hypothetical protein